MLMRQNVNNDVRKDPPIKLNGKALYKLIYGRAYIVIYGSTSPLGGSNEKKIEPSLQVKPLWIEIVQ